MSIDAEIERVRNLVVRLRQERDNANATIEAMTEEQRKALESLKSIIEVG